jgi:hypothetical protein
MPGIILSHKLVAAAIAPHNDPGMIFFLTSAPLWISGALIVGLGTVLAMLGPLVVRRYVALERLTESNEIAGFKYATLGVLYAVLLAFAIIVVWQRFNDADVNVSREAGAAETIYRLAPALGEAGPAVHGAVTDYLKLAITDDWPAMSSGKAGAGRASKQALDAIYAALLTFQADNREDTALVSEVLYQLDVMTQARRARLISAEGAVPGVIWVVLFAGAIIAIIFTFFFGTRNLPAQMMMTGLLALLIFSELLIIIAIDRPFTGSVKVEPTALSDVLADFGAVTGPHPAQPQNQ